MSTHNNVLRRHVLIAGILIWIVGSLQAQQHLNVAATICNPLNLSYRYMPDEPSRREAADPTIISFRNDYYLFASKSGGYWWSHDLITWYLVETNRIPVEDYAPTAVAIGDTVYFLASSSNRCTIYKSADPKSGRWMPANDSLPFPVTDPALFLDDDGRLYLYWGCSPSEPIHGVELDRKTLKPIGQPRDLLNPDTKNHGWENPGDYNELAQPPWIEGSSMNKFGGRYYLQYAAPGTEYFSYADGVYISDNPLGSFTYAPVNPFSYKPGGFIRGAGHGSTFTDRYGNLWHVATMTISVLHKFERRIGLFPTSLDRNGSLIADAGLTDRPFLIPNHRISGSQELSTGWMLLSYGKSATASSSLENSPPSNAVDENVRTSWCAKSGKSGEWLKIDLGKRCSINAVQVNFADNGTNRYGRDSSCYYQYRLEFSGNGKSWQALVDKSMSKTDLPHDYVRLHTPVRGRYLKLIAFHVPGGTTAISDLRVFGIGRGKKPEAVKSLKAVREKNNRCSVDLSWKKAAGAIGYMVRFGTDSTRLSYSYPVYGDTRLTLRSLNAGDIYYFAIEAFNENGISEPHRIISHTGVIK